ncbi:6-hydroxymethylpterin diphosphokinase MptE-like protein [Sulfurimonas sp.]|uniref:6-hydroxymethylpterin diphosphokinase MptE-like protein n=1 Tax=Sulfurimonas sp. TaxID=2022749 RepID=UPI00286E4ACC|nr:6-hydroxymethylpterin diphosphokinase MptE-like protein [Sulfurimonas sp.]
MHTIEQEAIKRYNNNLKYLSDNHQELFKQISIFNSALEQNLYKSKYELEYKDGYFDVFEQASGTFLYNENSQEHASAVAKSVNTQKENHLFDGLRTYDTNKRVVDIAGNDILKELIPIMHYANTHINPTMHMKKIEKFIFIGVGLGIHLLEVDKKIRSGEYLLIEDNLELFRLSLFTTDYEQLGKNSVLHFSVSQRANEFAVVINNFLRGTFMYNRFLKYYHLQSHDIEKIKLIQNALSIQPFMIFTYDFTLDKLLRPLEYINRGFRVLNLTQKQNNSPFLDKPVLLLAAGPSLQKNIAWVKSNQDKFIIVAISATLKKLYAEDIVPDIVTHVDGFEMSMLHYDGIPVESYLKDTLFILGPYAPKSLREMINQERIFYFEDETRYFENFGSLSAPCVGTTTLALMLIFGTAELYLLGLDLALDQKTGKTHGDDHFYAQEIDINKISLNETMNMEKNTFLVQGNFQKSVYTTSILDSSIQAVYGFMPTVKAKYQNIYNLNDGALLPETVPTPIQNIETSVMDSIDKLALHPAIYSSLSEHSALELSKEDMLSMHRRMEHVLWAKNQLKKHKKIRYKDIDGYYYHLLGLVSDLIKPKARESANLSNVLYSYFQYSLPIIFDLFNTRELANPLKHIKELDAILLSELLKIIKRYEDGLQSFFDSTLS